jgi:Kef-type K+ transport system membrane component KefB
MGEIFRHWMCLISFRRSRSGNWSLRARQPVNLARSFCPRCGLTFDLRALLVHGSTLLLVPVLLVALLVTRGLPALLYVRRLGKQKTLIAALLQSTSLPFIVAAAAIGIQQGLITQAFSAALILTGLLSVVIYPSIALLLLHRIGRR